MSDYKLKYIGFGNYIKVFPGIALKAVKRALAECFYALVVLLASFAITYIVLNQLF